MVLNTMKNKGRGSNKDFRILVDVMNVSLSLTYMVLSQVCAYMSQLIKLYTFLSIGYYYDLCNNATI